MNRLVAALMLFSVSSASVVQVPKKKSRLEEGLENVVENIPLAEIKSIVQGYLDNDDEEVRELYKFVTSEKLANIAEDIINLPEVQHQMKLLEIKGIHVVETYKSLVNLINKKLAKKVEPVIPNSTGVMALYNQISAFVPMDHIMGNIASSLLKNGEVRVLLDQVRESGVLKQVLKRKEIVYNLDILKELGVDTNAIERSADNLFEYVSQL